MADMAESCPKFDLARPPLPPRLPAIWFLPMGPFERLRNCESNPACSFALTVPWQKFANDSRPAPGGDRFLTAKVDSVAGQQGAIGKIWALMDKNRASDFSKFDPIAVRAAFTLRTAVDMSRDHFRHYFGSGNEHAGMLMKDVLRVYQGKLAVQHGFLKTKDPLPNERAADYVRRGGYLLWIDPNTGPFGAPGHIGKISVSRTSPGWLADVRGRGIDHFDLYIAYDPANEKMTYVVALRYEGDFEAASHAITKALGKAFAKACALATGDKAATAAAYAAAYPQATSYIAGWNLFAQACNMVMPKCPPPVRPNIGPIVANVVPQYPPGTIAWFDGRINMYRIAKPIGLAGFAATHVEVAQVTALPTGVVVVSRFAWENATKPLYARTWFVGTSAGVGVAALATITALALRRRAAR